MLIATMKKTPREPLPIPLFWWKMKRGERELQHQTIMTMPVTQVGRRQWLNQLASPPGLKLLHASTLEMIPVPSGSEEFAVWSARLACERMTVPSVNFAGTRRSLEDLVSRNRHACKDLKQVITYT